MPPRVLRVVHFRFRSFRNGIDFDFNLPNSFRNTTTAYYYDPTKTVRNTILNCGHLFNHRQIQGGKVNVFDCPVTRGNVGQQDNQIIAMKSLDQSRIVLHHTDHTYTGLVQCPRLYGKLRDKSKEITKQIIVSV